MSNNTPVRDESSPPLSLYHLLDPEVLADPYPLYRQLREKDPVHWDPYLHAWVVTRYEEVVEVLHHFKADRTPTPERLVELGMGELTPIAAVMVRQMLFLDPPKHGRVRRLASVAFTPRRIAVLREHIGQIAATLVDIGYLGDFSIYKLRLRDGAVIKAALANVGGRAERALTLGEEVWLIWPPESGMLLTQ